MIADITDFSIHRPIRSNKHAACCSFHHWIHHLFQYKSKPYKSPETWLDLLFPAGFRPVIQTANSERTPPPNLQGKKNQRSNSQKHLCPYLDLWVSIRDRCFLFLLPFFALPKKRKSESKSSQSRKDTWQVDYCLIILHIRITRLEFFATRFEGLPEHVIRYGWVK